MNRKKILILVVVILVVFFIFRRWQRFKADWIKKQQEANQQLIDSGQAAEQVTSPTVIQFITGGDSTGSGDSVTSGESESQTKSALIDAIEAKHGYTFSTGERYALMTYSIAQLEALLAMSTEELMEQITNMVF